MKRLNCTGQTLIALLIFMMLAITITTTSVTITIINAQTTNSYSFGQQAFQAAETGIEDALEQLMRNPNYTITNGTLALNSNTNVKINVSGTTTKTITSEATVTGIGTYVRKITATATIASNIVTLQTWDETP